MKVIAQKVWNEPAAAIGLITSLLLVLLELAAGGDWDVATIVAVAAPFASSLGIRQAVSPAAGPRPQEPPPGTTYQPPG